MLSEAYRRSAVEHVLSPSERTLVNIQNLLAYYQDCGLDARLIGSFGREASLRKQYPTAIHGKSDMDILLMGTDGNTPEATSKAQQIAKHDIFTNLFLQKGEKFFISYRDISIAVDPKILQLRIGSLAEKPIHTFDPNLLVHLPALFLPMRPKDKINLKQHIRDMKKIGDYLPEEMFEPFHILMDLKRKKYPNDIILGNLQYFYIRYVPKPISRVLRPVTKKFMKICIQNLHATD